jgi:hypothetical protein
MDNPGVYPLASLNLTAALSAQVQTAIIDLDGMTAVTLDAEFGWGSGGVTATAKVQTSFDGGTVWFDVAEFDFTTASRKAVCNLSGLLSKAVATYTALSSEGVIDGVLGNMLRTVVSTTGTYANTTLAVRASVR